MKRSERNMTQEKVMEETTTQYLLAHAQPIPEQGLADPSQVPSVYIQWVTFYGMEYLGQFGSAIPTMLPLDFLCTCLLSEHRSLKSPWFRARTTEQKQKHHYVIKIILILNQKHSSVPATWKKINSISSKNRKTYDLKLENLISYCQFLKKFIKTCFLQTQIAIESSFITFLSMWRMSRHILFLSPSTPAMWIFSQRRHYCSHQ